MLLSSRMKRIGCFHVFLLVRIMFIFLTFFTDDAIFRTMRCFFMAYGLQISLAKSNLIGVGVPIRQVEAIATMISCASIRIFFFFN